MSKISISISIKSCLPNFHNPLPKAKVYPPCSNNNIFAAEQKKNEKKFLLLFRMKRTIFRFGLQKIKKEKAKGLSKFFNKHAKWNESSVIVTTRFLKRSEKSKNDLKICSFWTVHKLRWFTIICTTSIQNILILEEGCFLLSALEL